MKEFANAASTKVIATRLIAIALAYFITGRLGLELAIVGSNITLIWLPTGIAVAALFRWGWRYWPAVWLGALSVNLAVGSSLPIAFAISVGNTLGPVLGVALLRRWHFNPRISNWSDVPVFVAGGALLGMLASATGGVATLVLGGLLPWSVAGTAWIAWWLGDSVGVVVAGMAFITFDRQEFAQLVRSRTRKDLVVSASVIAVLGLAWAVFPLHPLGYALVASLGLLALVWIALRLGPSPAAIAVLALSACAAWALATGRGPVLDQNIHLAIAKLWACITTISIVSMLMAALTSERKQAEDALKESEQRLRRLLAEQNALLENELVGIVTVKDRSIVWANPAFEKMLGYAHGELAGTPTRNNYPSDEAYRVFGAAAYPVLAAGKLFRSQFEQVRKDGSLVWLDVSGASLDQETGETLWGFTDISEYVSTVAELNRSNAELVQFSYAISHDMRQPLRMVSSYMQLLERSLANQLDGEQREYFDFAIDGAKRMDTMMLGLLDYSRVGRKGESPAWIESRAVLDEALLFLQPAIAEAQATIRVEGDWPKILVSPDEMLRLMQNLIGNGLKFRVAGRKPEVRVISGVIGNEWRVSITDNGVGILPDQIDRLFQVFQRLQSRADYEGTGIGLALCRKIAEHHGGRIWAESAGEGRGSTFNLGLPMALPKTS
jgi:PAS domain S-box-containing protein